MNKLFRSGISILLAVFILVGGGGIVIGKMICLHSGHVVYSLSEAKDCCGDEQNATSLKSKCCELTSIFIKSDHFVSQPRLDVPQSIAVTIPFVVELNIPVLLGASVVDTPANAPPPPAGTERLSFLSIYRI